MFYYESVCLDSLLKETALLIPVFALTRISYLNLSTLFLITLAKLILSRIPQNLSTLESKFSEQEDYLLLILGA